MEEQCTSGPNTDPVRPTVSDLLLGSLEQLVRRHRSLTPRDGRYSRLHAELIAAEVAHELALVHEELHGALHRGQKDGRRKSGSS